MSARSRMTHRVDVQRNTSLGKHADDWGSDSPPVWSNLTLAVHCHAWFETDKAMTDSGLQTNATVWIQFPLATDVTESDRLSSVTDRRGRTVAPGPLRIDSVARKTDHLLALAVAVT